MDSTVMVVSSDRRMGTGLEGKVRRLIHSIEMLKQKKDDRIYGRAPAWTIAPINKHLRVLQGQLSKILPNHIGEDTAKLLERITIEERFKAFLCYNIEKQKESDSVDELLKDPDKAMLELEKEWPAFCSGMGVPDALV